MAGTPVWGIPLITPGTTIQSLRAFFNPIAEALETALNSLATRNPTGEVKIFAGASAPSGYLLCQGQAVSRTTYAALFAVLGTTYGTGDGTSTFNLPDLRGRAPVGYSSGETEFNTVGKTGGEKTHTLTVAEMPSHSHNIKSQAANYPAGAFDDQGYQRSSTPNYTNNNTANIASTGGGGAHNNLQPYMTLNFIIKT
ncbi:phage tail protein [Agromyces larvae]|uniref:Tail fiber protein n=1 Tax=Agromyces larvae TaxID=2929802 RepID=A0ABY4C724_9MICO|nr:tail fiber protein [Agromyces larvae]UOE45896.1 tail fiber protein [Agromyces larvae]